MAKFENEFTKLIADDKSLWDKIKIEPSMISITERRLKVIAFPQFLRPKFNKTTKFNQKK